MCQRSPRRRLRHPRRADPRRSRRGLRLPSRHSKGVRLPVLLVLGLGAPAALAQAGLFSATGLDGWTEQTFEGKKPTRYRLIRESGVQVLEADCKASASGWI